MKKTRKKRSSGLFPAFDETDATGAKCGPTGAILEEEGEEENYKYDPWDIFEEDAPCNDGYCLSKENLFDDENEIGCLFDRRKK
jgi:hypothetical protein